MKLRNLSSPGGSSLFRILGTLLALALLIYLLGEQGWNEIWAAIQQIPAWRLVLAFGLMIVSRLVVSARWYILLRSAGVEISPSQAFKVNFAGLFANNFLFSTIGGDVVRLAGTIQLKFDTAICAASLIVDRLVGMAGMVVALPFGLPRFLEARYLQASISTASPFAIAGLASLPIGNWWKAAWEKALRIIQRLMSALGLWTRQPRALLASLLLTWIHMLCLFGFLSVLLEGMGEHLPLTLVGGLYSLVYFVTLIPISINGYGLQEVSMTLIFSTLGGASMANGLSVALLFRTAMMLASLPGAIFIPQLLPGKRRERIERSDP
jgi:uncharacterized membrane protein YbhN (UPF0104 family)